MGGATSLFDQNDWEKATGKLKDVDDTLDGASPTSKYGIYFITKRGVNQRDYDVTDDASNLLYTTRAVPGTIAWFDVMGRGMDEYILRVTVDISRRYWIVYRFDKPTYCGQKADDMASQKVAADFADKKHLKGSLLYKKCCITVSWSRYLAVSAFYGPPTMEMILAEQPDPSSVDVSDEEDALFEEAAKISDRMKERTTSEDYLLVPSVISEGQDDMGISDDDDREALMAMKGSPHSESAANKVMDKPKSGVEIAALSTSASMPELRILQPPADDDYDDSLKECPSSEPVVKRANHRHPVPPQVVLQEWLVQQSKSIKEKSQAILDAASLPAPNKQDPLEGVLNLDGPLLICQEIYNRIIGNHQTSLISKERVLELLSQDMAQHAKEHPDDGSSSRMDANPISTVKQQHVRAQDEAPGNGEEEYKESTLHDEPSTSDPATQESQPVESEQPLVGYWLWANTLRTHRMKMHVAKDADLALHVVMAIIVNQVRLERNVIAFTV